MSASDAEGWLKQGSTGQVLCLSVSISGEGLWEGHLTGDG